MSLTVACVFVKGNYPYTPEYVIRLRRMVQWHLPRQFRFVCFTDQPENIPAHAGRSGGWIETIRIPNFGLEQAYWHKVQVFNPAHGLSGRVLFLDLDTLIVDDLSPLVDYPAPFALAACQMALEKPVREVDAKGRLIIRKFNASAMVWDVGKTDRLWLDWTPAVASRLQGDQDWYAEQASDAAAMPVEWFPRLSRLDGPPFPDGTKVILAKKPKNHLAAKQYPWFESLWGGRN